MRDSTKELLVIDRLRNCISMLEDNDRDWIFNCYSTRVIDPEAMSKIETAISDIVRLKFVFEDVDIATIIDFMLRGIPCIVDTEIIALRLTRPDGSTFLKLEGAAK